MHRYYTVRSGMRPRRTANHPRVYTVEIAEHLGITRSWASRLRHGRTPPSYRIMLLIQDWLDWPIGEQSQLRELGLWHDTFNTIIDQRWARSPKRRPPDRSHRAL